MTTKIDDISESGNRSRWQKLTAKLTAIDEAMSYDPQEHRDAIIKSLWERVARLETKVSDLEGRGQRVA